MKSLEDLSIELKRLNREKKLATRLELWAWLLNYYEVKTVAEIGVWRGEFSEYILRNVSSITSYIMIDPWANLATWNKPLNNTRNFDRVMEEAIERIQFAKEKVSVLRGCTAEMAQHIDDNSLDFVYIDGDHTLRGITIDLITILPKVSDHGLIGGDDFTRTPWQHSFEFEPTLVCPFAIYYAEASNYQIMAAGKNQFLMKKDAAKGFKFIDTYGHYSDLSLNRCPPGMQLISSTPN